MMPYSISPFLDITESGSSAGSNGVTAIGVQHVLFEANLKVPDNFSLIGFDDIHLAEYTHSSDDGGHVMQRSRSGGRGQPPVASAASGLWGRTSHQDHHRTHRAPGHWIAKGCLASDAALGRSRGDITTKIHLLADESGLPVSFLLIGG
jgi:hypothetical protein